MTKSSTCSSVVYHDCAPDDSPWQPGDEVWWLESLKDARFFGTYTDKQEAFRLAQEYAPCLVTRREVTSVSCHIDDGFEYESKDDEEMLFIDGMKMAEFRLRLARYDEAANRAGVSLSYAQPDCIEAMQKQIRDRLVRVGSAASLHLQDPVLKNDWKCAELHRVHDRLQRICSEIDELIVSILNGGVE